MANVNDTIKQVEKLNPELAAELKRYVKSQVLVQSLLRESASCIMN